MVEEVIAPYHRKIKVSFPPHWMEFLEQEARRVREATGIEDFRVDNVVYSAVKEYAYKRGFIQLGSNSGGILIEREEKQSVTNQD
ncbi:MAG TPA: hypothetical protein VEP90_06515 [Methylomirabilota bacterium]|nr:hypothetical protein [Methylomirabilota bacterium]